MDNTAKNPYEKMSFMESLILAQNERWRRGLGMQVVRELTEWRLRPKHCKGEWRKGE